MARPRLIEAMINQELGDPFRRDAMKKPVVVAGIDAKDMRKQPSALGEQVESLATRKMRKIQSDRATYRRSIERRLL
jgi:hypothetical protein